MKPRSVNTIDEFRTRMFKRVIEVPWVTVVDNRYLAEVQVNIDGATLVIFDAEDNFSVFTMESLPPTIEKYNSCIPQWQKKVITLLENNHD